jgi:hypothetical protein
MTEKKTAQHAKIQEFVAELTTFADEAEATLKKIEEDLEANKGSFSVFVARMIAIRGTAQQLELQKVALIAGLGEEIAVKGSAAETRAQIRKCVGSLWDALTTIKHLLLHYTADTSEEEQILINRMEATLRALGGSRPKVSTDEIEALLKARG